MIAIIDKEEDHLSMQGALEALIVDGSRQAAPLSAFKVIAWYGKPIGTGTNPRPGEPTITYKWLRMKAETAIFFIEDRCKRASQ